MDDNLNNNTNTKQTFEWDENKNILNLEKHGISFEDASKVFDDEKRLDLPDKKHSQQEDRRIVIGMVEKIIFVVYTKRVKNVRIISVEQRTKKKGGGMIITITEDDIKKPLSAEAKKRIIEASKRPILYDDDCPEFTDEELKEMVEQAKLEKTIFKLS